MYCRMCKGKNLFKFLDLEFTPPADEFRQMDQLNEPITYYPLSVYMCSDCGLAQLGYVVAPEILYQRDYPYESSTTKCGREHFDLFAASVSERFSLTNKDLVIDIGSNVGVLLEGFKKRGTRILGVDPANNIVKIAQERGIETMCTFFGLDCVTRILRLKGKAKVITATNVFAHIDDLYDVMKSVDSLLEKDGIFIFESPYFYNLLKNLEYDTIYHEHLSYISVKPLIPFLPNSRWKFLIYSRWIYTEVPSASSLHERVKCERCQSLRGYFSRN